MHGARAIKFAQRANEEEATKKKCGKLILCRKKAPLSSPRRALFLFRAALSRARARPRNGAAAAKTSREQQQQRLHALEIAVTILPGGTDIASRGDGGGATTPRLQLRGLHLNLNALARPHCQPPPQQQQQQQHPKDGVSISSAEAASRVVSI